MKLVRYYVGTSYDKDDKPISDTLNYRATRSAERHLAFEYGGCTRVTGIGSWVNRADILVTETSVIFEVVVSNAVPYEKLYATKEFLRLEFNQTEVLMVILPMVDAGKPASVAAA